jgi:alpha-1,2-mannosyltransferase
MRFIKSEFAGLLPSYYDTSLGFPDVTRRVPTNQNDANREETDRYIDVDKCEYLIDLRTVWATRFLLFFLLFT